jgi:hypothetical protein
LEDAIVAAVRAGDLDTARLRLADMEIARADKLRSDRNGHLWYSQRDGSAKCRRCGMQADGYTLAALQTPGAELIGTCPVDSDLAYKAPEQLPAFAGGQGREAASVESDAGGWLAQLAAVAMFGGILFMCWYLLS